VVVEVSLQLDCLHHIRYAYAMTIQQMVEISADHRLLLDIRVPSELPTGKTMVELTFNSDIGISETVVRNAVKSLRGLFKDTDDSLEAFMERKHADKALEYEIEERRIQEREG
jgi:hypothetical protein